MDVAAQVLFGINGFRVVDAVLDRIDDELVVLVETITRVGVARSGVVGQVKERPVVKVRDATSGGGTDRSTIPAQLWIRLVEEVAERGPAPVGALEVGAAPLVHRVG